MARTIMIQGTMSNAGKSVIATGLCRLFTQDGYDVAPFKSQNMALNSFITLDGGEMGRAQVVQAEACGKAPVVAMNPVLLKPVTDQGSQVIVHGQARGVMSARDYFATRASLMPEIMSAFDSLAASCDIIVIEGAGSPAEINLRTDDIVNMGLAKRLGAPVLLVGDIDRGGVFAQLVGTCALLADDERELVKGLIINKLRGDASLLGDGLSQLEALTNKPVLGVVPYLPLDIDDEDSLAERLNCASPAGPVANLTAPAASLTAPVASPAAPAANPGACDVAVVRLPKVSNFTDFTALGATDGFSVRYVATARELGTPDLLILPGTRNTIADLLWLRERGLDRAVLAHAARGGTVVGICGGYQMLGRVISDPEGVEGGGTVPGLGLLPITTTFRPVKQQTRVTGTVLGSAGALAAMAGAGVEGYEIHMGLSARDDGAPGWVRLEDGSIDGCYQGNVYGTYLHGLFDTTSARSRLAAALGVVAAQAPVDYRLYREAQYDQLADALRACLDMGAIYEIVRGER